MAKTGSYIKIDRGLKKNALWLERPFSKGQAWVDLLLLAQGVEMDKHYRGQVQHMEPGTVYTSVLYLSNRWGWSRNKVYRFLDVLISAQMIAIQGRTSNGTINRTSNETNDDTKNGTTNGTIISIENWAFYQNSDTNNGTKNGTVNGTTDGTQNGTHNRKHTEKANRESKQRIYNGRSAPNSPSGEKQDGGQYNNAKAGRMMPREQGTYEDIPLAYRDGTYQSFSTYAEYWDWRNQ